MEKTDPKERCRTCYRYTEDEPCLFCKNSPSPFYKTYAPFEECRATLALIHQLRSDSGAHLASSLAGLLLLSLEKSPLRDYDIIVPSHDSGSLRLAQAFSTLTGHPCLNCFKKNNLLDQTTILQSKSSPQITEKRILFISTGMHPFSHYLHEGRELASAFPRSIQKLFFQFKETI
jgi:predicted amidophosphoribosyltransferase